MRRSNSPRVLASSASTRCRQARRASTERSAAARQSFLSGADQLCERLHFKILYLVIDPFEEFRIELIEGQPQSFLKHVGGAFALLVKQEHLLDGRESEFLIDVVADQRGLVIRHENLVLVFRPNETVIQVGRGKKFLSFNGGEVIELHLIAPAGKSLAFLVDRKPLRKPPWDFMVGYLKRDDVSELVPEGTAPVE